MADRPTQQNVMLAILALDAYSRGANPQLQYATGNEGELARTIGTATWELSSTDLERAGKLDGAAAVGFSASHYDMDGKTIISYRGNRKRLSDNPGQLPKLRPDEWKGGEQLWIIDLAGEPAAVAGSLKLLAATQFNDKQVKMLLRDSDTGAARVAMLAESFANESGASAEVSA